MREHKWRDSYHIKQMRWEGLRKPCISPSTRRPRPPQTLRNHMVCRKGNQAGRGGACPKVTQLEPPGKPQLSILPH